MPSPPEDPRREVCLCFHVTLGKLVHFARRQPMRVATQFAECHGAGTGCGWCVPHLERLHAQLQAGEPPHLAMPMEEYQRLRREYHRTRKPDLPPPPDADGPLPLDLDAVFDEIPDDEKLD